MSQFAHPTGALGTAFSVAWLAIATTTTVAFAVAAFGLAHHLAAPAGNASLAPGVFPGSWIRDGGPLRLLGRTLIVRAAVGVPLAIIVAVGVGQGAAGAGLLGVIAGCIASVVIAGMMMTALAGQRSFPDGLSDRDALAFAMVIAAIAPLLDIWGAVATGQLLSLVGDARRATSIWNMPSFREIESLEAMASWTGRISIGLGLVGSFAVVRSLAATAHALGDGPQIARAGRVRALLVWGAGAAIATLVVITNVRLRGDEGTVFLLATAGILLSIGIALFVGLLRLAYGLANAIEKPAPPPAPAEISLPAS
jgi:hypothetical protein